MKRQFIRTLALLALLLPALANAQQAGASAPMQTDPTEAHTLSLQGTLLLDVREQDEYDEVHAPRAKLIPLGQLRNRVAELAEFKDKPILVMCYSGVRSQKAAKFLQENGFTHVSSVAGGIVAWQKAGLEVIKR